MGSIPPNHHRNCHAHPAAVQHAGREDYHFFAWPDAEPSEYGSRRSCYRL